MVYERSYRMSGPVVTAIGDHLWVGVPSWFLISRLLNRWDRWMDRLSFGWGEGENVTSARWQLTLCDPIWHVSSCNDEASC